MLACSCPQHATIVAMVLKTDVLVVQSIAVTCLIAVIDEGLGDAVAAAVAEDLDASCRLPAECAGTLPQLVVGTLDINQGQLSLPTSHVRLQPSARCTDCGSCGWRAV